MDRRSKLKYGKKTSCNASDVFKQLNNGHNAYFGVEIVDDVDFSMIQDIR
jgi:hypothetical protein